MSDNIYADAINAAVKPEEKPAAPSKTPLADAKTPADKLLVLLRACKKITEERVKAKGSWVWRVCDHNIRLAILHMEGCKREGAAE
jgi:hypothetical protein